MSETPSVKVRLPDGIISLVDAYASAIGVCRSESIRLLVVQSLASDHCVSTIKRGSDFANKGNITIKL
jgi:hypothetical protein